ncbi:MAG: thrombospondin type 3 repeat-containing protein, partial [Planctomycetes bacterium]|nr:thrombospondin type 3 repeat-containing protein [Planctomycetota bacterium]
MSDRYWKRRHRFVGVSSIVLLAAFVAGCPTDAGTSSNTPATGTTPTQESTGPSEPPASFTVPVEVVGNGEVVQSPNGKVVTLTAIADVGWRFEQWGGVSSTANPVTIVADPTLGITAVFVEDIGDGDLDGVGDDVDLCQLTPAGAVVDADGCADSERDTDGDSIVDADDACPNTPADVAQSVNPNGDGCALSERDSDEDGVTDDVDECPGTPLNCPAEADGCCVKQQDDDGDGVENQQDSCPNTLPGAVVNVAGCSVPFCGDGNVDSGEECDGGDFCDANCTIVPGCGNGVFEPSLAEECDPPNGVTCDDSCQLIGATCGDGACDAGEDFSNCPSDCAAPTCGDGVCDPGEDTTSCPADCTVGGPACGDGVCDAGEDATSCPADCGGATGSSWLSDDDAIFEGFLPVTFSLDGTGVLELVNVTVDPEALKLLVGLPDATVTVGSETIPVGVQTLVATVFQADPVLGDFTILFWWHLAEGHLEVVGDQATWTFDVTLL